jgi:hypothetical protein
LKTKKYSNLKNALAYCNAGVVGVNSKVVGLAPGTDVMIFKNIFAEKFSEKWRFLLKLCNASFCKKYDHNTGF